MDISEKGGMEFERMDKRRKIQIPEGPPGAGGIV
jgi:hypothetical protein